MSVTITVPKTTAAGAAAKIEIITKNCTLFTNCIRERDNTQIDNGMSIDIVMPMYNLTEYSDDYSKTSGGLWHWFRDEPFLDNDAIDDFLANSNKSASFKFKTKIVGRTGNGTKNIKIRVPLKYLSNF